MAAKGLGFAAFFSSLAQSVPMLYQTEIEAKKRREGKEAKGSAMDILRGFETSYEEPAAPTPEPKAPPPAAAAAPVGVDPTMGMAAPPTAMGEVAGTKEDLKTKVKAAVPKLESNNNYKALGPIIESGKYKGQRALGKYQIMPSLHFHKIGLDSNNRYDKNKFINNPELQDKLYDKVFEQMWTDSGENPRKFHAMYYGSGSAKPVPKAGGKTMPTGKEYWEKAAKEIGIDPESFQSTTTTTTTRTKEMAPVLTAAMEEVIREKPKKPKKRTSRAGEKLKHFYQRATAEEIEAVQPALSALSSLSKIERDEMQQEWNRYDKAADRRLRAILTQATIEAGISKADRTAGRKATGEQLKKLKAYRNSLQKQMDTFRDISKKYATAKPSQRKKIEAAWPDYFVETDRRLFGKKTEVNELVQSKLQQQIDEVDRTLEVQIGLPSPTLPKAGAAPAPTEGGKLDISAWISKK